MTFPQHPGDWSRQQAGGPQPPFDEHYPYDDGNSASYAPPAFDALPPMNAPGAYPAYQQPAQPTYPLSLQPGNTYGGQLQHSGDPGAPYGRDPKTGLPLSDKSKMTAGLLQLFFGCFGAGRFYLGLNQTATAQLCLGALGVLTGMLLIIGLPLFSLRLDLGSDRRHHDLHRLAQGPVRAATS